MTGISLMQAFHHMNVQSHMNVLKKEFHKNCAQINSEVYCHRNRIRLFDLILRPIILKQKKTKQKNYSIMEQLDN